MGFGGKVDNGARLVLLEQLLPQAGVADIALNKHMARILGQRGQVGQVARVGELVEVDDRLIMVGQPVEYEIGANEARAAGDQNHVLSLVFIG